MSSYKFSQIFGDGASKGLLRLLEEFSSLLEEGKSLECIMGYRTDPTVQTLEVATAIEHLSRWMFNEHCSSISTCT